MIQLPPTPAHPSLRHNPSQNLNHAATTELDACRSRGSSLSRALASSQEQTLQERQRLEQHSASSERRLQLLDEECQHLRQQLSHAREDNDRDCQQLRDEMFRDRDAHAEQTSAMEEQHGRDTEQLGDELRARTAMFEDARQRYEEQVAGLREDNELLGQRADLADRTAQELDDRLSEVDEITGLYRKEYEVATDGLEKRVQELESALERSQIELATARQQLENRSAALEESEKSLHTALQANTVSSSSSSSAPTTNNTNAKSLTALEIDYEVKLGEMNDKLAVATRKLQNMDRRINRNQRCQSLDSPVPPLTILDGRDRSADSETLLLVESLKQRLASLEKSRLAPCLVISSLRSVCTHPGYTRVDQVLADLRRVLIRHSKRDLNREETTDQGNQAQLQEEEDEEEEDLHHRAECYRMAYLQQLMRESLVLGKMAAIHPAEQETKQRQDGAGDCDDAQQREDCRKLLVEAFAYLDGVQGANELSQLQEVSGFLCGQLMLIGDLCPSDLPRRPRDLDPGSLTSSITSTNQLLTGQSHGNLILSLDAFCYRACSLLSGRYESFTSDSQTGHRLRCRGQLLDDRLYAYVDELFHRRQVMNSSATPACLRGQAVSLNEYRESLDAWSDEAWAAAVGSFEAAEMGLLERVRLGFERACWEARLCGVDRSRQLDLERLRGSQSLVEKLEGEIKRLWRLVDQVCRRDRYRDRSPDNMYLCITTQSRCVSAISSHLLSSISFFYPLDAKKKLQNILNFSTTSTLQSHSV